MLSELLSYLHNWFVVPGGIHGGRFTIAEGALNLPFLREGQYFRIVGSVLNDGVYPYPASELTDEDFDGAVWALAIPKEVLELAEEIRLWTDKYGEISLSPYYSESFGGYSYYRGSRYSKTGAISGPTGWQDAFGARLNRWRKV